MEKLPAKRNEKLNNDELSNDTLNQVAGGGYTSQDINNLNDGFGRFMAISNTATTSGANFDEKWVNSSRGWDKGLIDLMLKTFGPEQTFEIMDKYQTPKKAFGFKD